MATSSIEWTDATWNPVRGCTKISPGCKHCYAETFAERWRGIPGHPYEQGFDLRLVPEKLADPLRRRKPTTYFVNSMSDLFHELVPFEYIAAVFGVMAACSQHTFQVLTKRPERIREWFAWVNERPGLSGAGHRVMEQPPSPHPFQVCADAASAHGLPITVRGLYEQRGGGPAPWPLPNVWLGVSVENRKHGVPRISVLREVPAAVRFLSVEPLLEDLCALDLAGIEWVIVGGESGPGARPMHPDWARNIRDQVLALRRPCADCNGSGRLVQQILHDDERPPCPWCSERGWRGPAMFFKQWGEWGPTPPDGVDLARVALFSESANSTDPVYLRDLEPSRRENWYEGQRGDVFMYRVGKAKAGRELDGRTWDEMPRPKR